MILEAQDDVGEQHPGEAEHEERNGVADPVLLLVRIDADHAISQALDRFDQDVQPGFAPDVEHVHEIDPERFGDEQQSRDIQEKLKPVIHGVSGTLKLLRTKHRHEEIDEQPKGDQPYDNIFHDEKRVWIGAYRTFWQK